MSDAVKVAVIYYSSTGSVHTMAARAAQAAEKAGAEVRLVKVAELAPADTCVSAVLTVPEAVADAQYNARGAFVEATSPDPEIGDGGRFRQVGTLLAGTGTDRAAFDLPDTRTTATAELLGAAGYSHDQIAALREEGVIA